MKRKDIFFINGHVTATRTFDEIYYRTGWGYDSTKQYVEACIAEGLLIKSWNNERHCYEYTPTQKFFLFKEKEPLKN